MIASPQFSMNDQFSIYNAATAWKMLNVKLLFSLRNQSYFGEVGKNVKYKLLNGSGGSV